VTFAKLWVGDLVAGDLGDVSAEAIYTDPPWNPGMARIMRQWAHADTGPVDYLELVCRTALAFARACPSGPWYLQAGPRPSVWREGLRRCSPLPIHTIPATWGTVANPKPYYVLCANGAPPIPSGLHGKDVTRAVMGQVTSKKSILDPFMGKGQTLRHAIPLGVSVFGMEINPKRLAAGAAWVERHHPEVDLSLESGGASWQA